MRQRRLRVRGGGHIRIDRGWLSPPQQTPGIGERSTPPAPGDDAAGTSRAISLGAGVIERAEIITEGVFRPGAEDIEVKYVMSGKHPARLDRLHPLASDQIISDATPVSVMTNVDQMIEFVKRSGAGDARLIVDLHTHPSSGVALPSDVDMKTWRQMTELLAKEFPNARFLFGVHGVGLQSPGFLERTLPTREGVNRLIWRSNTRNHVIALFAPDSSPVEVRFVG